MLRQVRLRPLSMVGTIRHLRCISNHPSSSEPDLREMVLYSSQFSAHYLKLKKAKLEAVENMKIHRKRESGSLKFSAVHHMEEPFVAGNQHLLGNVVPVALQHLQRNPIPQVQGADASPNELPDIVIEPPVIEGGKPHFPFGNYDSLTPSHESLDPEVTVEPLGRRQRRRRRGDGRRRIGGAEKADFEVISANLEPDEAKNLLEQDEFFKYGTADPTVRASKVPCGGCGSHLHCNDVKLPGFIPVELFGGKSKQHLLHTVCQRCYVMKKYDVALKVSVSPDDYPKTMEHLKHKMAIVLVVVDLVDFPGSVWPDLIPLLGSNKHIFLVGNKADLLPQDSDKYLRRVERSMKVAFLKKCKENGVEEMPTIANTLLVSARTGFNIEVLIDQLFFCWKDRMHMYGKDVYIVGTTNVGKSSVFNALLDSDLCRHSAVDRVEKAMTSQVPGTTLNLLKFPMSRPDPSRLSKRHLRLSRDSKLFRVTERIRLSELSKTKDRRLAIVAQPVRRTADFKNDKNTVFQNSHFDFQPDIQRERSEGKSARFNPDAGYAKNFRWCFDTPGSVSSDQIINLLTQEEIAITLANDLPILPRTYLLRVGHTLFIGGLARLDILSGPLAANNKLLVTVFTADGLPINVVKTIDADAFYTKALGSELLRVPRGGNERLEEFPPLVGVEMPVDGISRYESSCDVVLSSAGWVSCSPNVAQVFNVKAWTPGGKGIFLRDPPFLPFAVQLRGDLISNSPAFTNDRFFIPPF